MAMFDVHSASLMNRLMAKTQWKGECLEWTGATRAFNGHHYGVIRTDGGRNSKNAVASRVALEWKLGRKLVNGEEVAMHSCDNPLCVNPDHLSVGTYRDNTQDMIRKGRHPTFTLTSDDAAEIRRRCASGERQSDVARSYKVHQSTVNKIVHNKRQAVAGGK